MREDNRRSSDEEPLKDLIDKFLKAYSLEGKMKEYDIIAAWPELMGKAVAHRTKELCIKQQTLYLKIDSSVMREELLNGKQIIIERVNKEAGCQLIHDIWFS
jgi:NAD(P)H-flavin reductase